MNFFYEDTFNHFYAVRPRKLPNSVKKRKIKQLRRSRSFKVTNYGTNGKLIYDILLVINTNLPAIFVSDIAIFVLKRDVKLQLTN